MTGVTQNKKDYVSHHLPVRNAVAIAKDKAALPAVYTTTETPVVTRGMTGSRLFAAGLIIFGHLVFIGCILDTYYNLSLKPALLWWATIYGIHWFTGIPGITAGAHRLWAHRSYKANLPVRIFLAFCNSIANQSSILHWAVEHRVHHRHVDTDADPHNINRGFFYCHMGWLFTPRTDAFAKARKEIDDSDLRNDPVVYYQNKYYAFIGPFCCYILPGIIAKLVADEYWRGVAYLGFARWLFTLHITWCVNSVAHTFGTRPYRPEERATENGSVSFFSGGEGWHNYHHAFPWDYAASEDRTDLFWRFNIARFWIDMFAYFGAVTDRKVQRNVFGVAISSPEQAEVPADFKPHQH